MRHCEHPMWSSVAFCQRLPQALKKRMNFALFYTKVELVEFAWLSQNYDLYTDVQSRDFIIFALVDCMTS